MHLLQKQKETINGRKVIYHGRLEGGLKVIPVHKCKHDKAYVYASSNIALCIIFAVKRKGENIDFGVGPLGKTYIKEFYEGGLEDKFSKRKCYLYKLPEDRFTLETEYIERVSPTDVEVLAVEEIPDSLEFLLKLEKEKKIKIYRYKDMTKKQKLEVESELIKRLKAYANFVPLKDSEYKKLTGEAKLGYDVKKERYDFCINKFPDLMSKICNK